MTCDEIQDLLPAFVTGDLQAESSVRIQQHLETCDDCALWYGELIEMLRTWQHPVPEEAPNVTWAVLHRLESGPIRLDAPSPGPGPTHTDHGRFRRQARKSVFFHYGLAASLTVALFNFGAFARWGNEWAHANTLISLYVSGIVHYVAHISV